MLSRDRGQTRAKPFEWIVPHSIARQRIEAEDFAVTGSQQQSVLQDDVHEIRAFKVCGPDLLAGGAIKSYHRPFDADEY